MKKLYVFLFLIFFPVLLACRPGPDPVRVAAPGMSIQNPLNQPQDTPSVFTGQPAVPVFLGGTGTVSSDVNWTVVGPGRIQNQAGEPISKAPPGSSIFYLPPPAGTQSSTATISGNYTDSFNTTHDNKLVLSITAPTAPMQFGVYSASKVRGAPLFSGDQDTMLALPNPMPVDPHVIWTLQAVDPLDGDPGSLVPSTNPRNPFSTISAIYTAPAHLTTRQSVLITAELLDPWTQKTVTSSWPIDLQIR